MKNGRRGAAILRFANNTRVALDVLARDNTAFSRDTGKTSTCAGERYPRAPSVDRTSIRREIICDLNGRAVTAIAAITGTHHRRDAVTAIIAARPATPIGRRRRYRSCF